MIISKILPHDLGQKNPAVPSYYYFDSTLSTVFYGKRRGDRVKKEVK